jgi:hypothetical protein
MATSRKKKIIQVVDIVPSKMGKPAKIPITVSRVTPRPITDDVDRADKTRSAGSANWRDADSISNAPTSEERGTLFARSSKRPSLDEELSGSDFNQSDRFDSSHRRAWRWMKIAGWVIGVAIVGYGLYGALYLLPRIDVTILSKKVNSEFHDVIVVNKNIVQYDTSTNQIPGQIVSFPSTSTQNNHVFSFVPTGNAYHEEKAQGTIVIVNTSNPAPQKLVATTRFQAPDGKIVRLVDGVVVPGVTGTGPATITAAVVADKVGPSYNIGPIDKLTIPGFAGTSKFDIYYGQIKTPLTGGFAGTGAYPTKNDIAQAKSQAESLFQETLVPLLQTNLGSDYHIVDGAVRLATTTERVDPTVGADGKFSVYIEGSLQALVFRQADVHSVLAYIVSQKLDDPSAYDITNEKLDYRAAQIDWKKGTMTLPLDYSATLTHRIDADAIAHGSVGKGEVDLKTYILGIPGVEKVTISFWPFWVSSAPTRIDKIHVMVR